MSARTVIHTYTGEVLDLSDPSPNNIHTSDITIALSRIRRFNGHTLDTDHKPWTVLHHSVFVHDLIMLDSPASAPPLDGLLHDAHEAYIGDIATPVKNMLGRKKLHALALSLDSAIRCRYGLSPQAGNPTLVARADQTALKIEASALLRTYGVPEINDTSGRDAAGNTAQWSTFTTIRHMNLGEAGTAFVSRLRTALDQREQFWHTPHVVI